MSDNGFVFAFRRAWHHPAFRDLLDAGIWNYLFQNAAWREESVFVESTRHIIRRGQIFISYRGLAKSFCCSEARIRRLIGRLTNDAMITTQLTHRGSIVTICNYEQYQHPDESPDAQLTHNCRASDAPIYKDNEKNNRTTTKCTPEFEAWYEAYPRKAGKQAAIGAYHRALAKAPHDVLMAQTRQFAAYCERQHTELRYIPHPATWLNGESWKNSYAKPVVGASWG